MAPTGSHGGGGHRPHGSLCPGTFQVLPNDRIGTPLIPRAQYAITLLSVGRLACTQAASFFSSFLQESGGGPGS